jgi:TatD DNase family protein
MEEILISKYKEKSFSGVLHCFTGSKKLAKAALDIGLYISFSGIVTFKNSSELQEIASYVPSDRYLVETDSPFLSPVPFRGKTNEPKNVYFIAKFISNLRKISIDLVSQQTYQNTLNLFSNMRNE